MPEEFKENIQKLVEEVESLRSSIGSIMSSLSFDHKFSAFRLSRYLEKHGKLLDDAPDGSKRYDVSGQNIGKVKKLERSVANSLVAESLLPESLLVTLVSRYDAFLGRLIRAMVLIRPELLKSSERSLSLDQLLELGDYDSAREYLIEKEIESVLRTSHSDHFDWLENKLGIPLRKDLAIWPQFIELTERRNLLVHCDGLVSHQYIVNCKRASALPPKVRLGDRLDAPPKYYRSACDCIMELAVKLTHVVWRKLVAQEREVADNALNNTCIDLLIHGNFKLANELLRFANSVLKKHATEWHRLVFLINVAQSYKWLGNDAECVAALDQEDWSAKSAEFRLCESVLREQYDKAISIMKQIGKEGSVKASDYRVWPVFRKVRKDKKFQDAYSEIFGEALNIGESVVRVTQDELLSFLKSLVSQDTEPPSSLPSGGVGETVENNQLGAASSELGEANGIKKSGH